MMYEVFITGGKDDGKVIGVFTSKSDAINYAEKFCREHETMLGIVDENNDPIEW